MKLVLTSIICLLLHSISFLNSESNTIGGKSDCKTPDGTWKLLCYKDLSTSTTIPNEKLDDRSVILKFETTGKQGFLKGHTLKNPLSGQYFLEKNNLIKFWSVGIERQDNSRNEWGDNLEEVLLAVKSYSCNNDTLFLNYEENNKALLLIRTSEKLIQQKPVFR